MKEYKKITEPSTETYKPEFFVELIEIVHVQKKVKIKQVKITN